MKPDKAEDKTKIVEEEASSGSKTVKPERAEEKTKTVEEVKQEGDKEEEGEEGWTTVDGKKKKRKKKKKEKSKTQMTIPWRLIGILMIKKMVLLTSLVLQLEKAHSLKKYSLRRLKSFTV